MSETTIDKPQDSAWSYSRLHQYELCPRQFEQKTLLKLWPEPPSEQQSFGSAVHAAMAEGLRTKKSMPLAYAPYQKWVDRVLKTPGELLVESECQWAIDRNKEPTTWFSKQVWMRAMCDAAVIDLEFPAAAYIVDWKTGKSANVDPLQLTLMALMAFCQFPTLLRVRADFVWLTEDSETSQVICKDEIKDHWAEVMPRVARMQKAIEEDHFPPLPNRLCKRWCNVLTCEYNGK